MDQQEFNFTVDSALLGELGERLVPADYIALSELVKNSYDADADEVSVEIQKQGNSIKYTISDDGSGMTFEEVQKYWMKIGTTNKQENERSKKYGRLRTGAKGIGRFSVRRLGPSLKLITIALIEDGKLEKTEVKFDWEKFSPGSDVTKITSIGNREIISSGKTGTTLIVSGKKRDILTQRGFNTLRRQLLKLASYAPNIVDGYKEDNGFDINVIAHDYEDPNEPKDIRERLFKAGWAELTGNVDKNGKANYKLESSFIGKKNYKRIEKFESLRNASFRISIVPSVSSQLRNPKLLAKYVTNEIKKEWGGVYARFNGFRVYPYGDSGDDWLNIEKDRARRLAKPANEQLVDFAFGLPNHFDADRPMLSLLSSNSFIGYVDIFKESKLVPKLDRQGFIENQAFDELREFVRFGIDWSTIYRNLFVAEREEERRILEVKKLEKVLDLDFKNPEEAKIQAIRYIDKTIERVTRDLDPIIRRETREKVEQSFKVINAIDNERNTQLEQLRLIASTSTTTLLFAHEVKILLSTLAELSSSLKMIESRVSNPDKGLIGEYYNSIQISRENLSDLLSFTFSVLPSRGSGEKIRLNLKKNLKSIVSMFSGILKHYSVDVDYSTVVSSSLTTHPIRKVELFAPLVNVFSNALKAVIAKEPPRRILFEAEKNGKFIDVRISDTGIGLKPENYDRVFNLFEVDPEQKLYNRLRRKATDEDLILLGEGTGIGLPIARDILKSIDGDLFFDTPKSDWTTTVKMKIPSA